MESVSHLSTIPTQLYLEHFENSLNLVGKSVTYINTLINTDDLYNVPDFVIIDVGGHEAYFPRGNYTFEEFIQMLINVTSELPVHEETGFTTDEKGPFRMVNDGKDLACLTEIPYIQNDVFYHYLPSPYNRHFMVDDLIPLTEDYIRDYITWYKVYMLRVYCNFIDSDNDLITIPLYSENGLDNTYSISDLCIPCVDGIYNDIQWSVYDQLDNPVIFPSSKLYVYFTASW